MSTFGISQGVLADRTVRELVKFGFPEARAREAVGSIGDASDVQLALNWLLDHGEEDKGGAVQFVHCSHLDDLGPDRLVSCSELVFGNRCLHGCASDENWLCLMCGETRCGRYAHRHSLQHWEQTKQDGEATLTVAEAAAGQRVLGHCLAISLADLSVWCYECQAYVEHKKLMPLVKQMERLKFGESRSESDASSGTKRKAQPVPGSPIPAEPVAAHGVLGDLSWPMPKLARACDDEARPGYKTMLAHEYLDEPQVLQAKVKVLAGLILRSKNLVAYTGAGISTSAGVQDYATRAGDSVAASRKSASPWEAQPTFAHRALVALHRKGHLKHWVQQNHDGLPQKAGFPQRHLNEIHGAWYDPSNPVVPMSGTLREDLMKVMLEWEDRVDLCLALGTSMVGMNADRIAVQTAEQQRRGVKHVLGTVIVTLQRTQYDSLASLRIFAHIDRVMEMLVEEMALVLLPSPPVNEERVLTGLPYGPDGKHDIRGSLTLDLSSGRKLRVVNQPAWDIEKYGPGCEVVDCEERFGGKEGHVVVRFGPAGSSNSVLRVLGNWWLGAAKQGAVDVLPVVPWE